ncbi:MAG: hypothetical protein ABEJ75_02300 [Candidatus Nanohaloarchaea archaeon]
MLCVLSFIVFAFLGIFFAEYRELAREAFDCMLQRAKTGECDADFETRIRSTIIGKAMERDRRLARFLNRHLEKITWLLLIILVVAGFFAVEGLYNYIAYGNCAGPNAHGGCALGAIDPRNWLPFLEPEVNLPGNYSG